MYNAEEKNNTITHIVLLKENLFLLSHSENFTTYLTSAVCTYLLYEGTWSTL